MMLCGHSHPTLLIYRVIDGTPRKSKCATQTFKRLDVSPDKRIEHYYYINKKKLLIISQEQLIPYQCNASLFQFQQIFSIHNVLRWKKREKYIHFSLQDPKNTFRFISFTQMIILQDSCGQKILLRFISTTSRENDSDISNCEALKGMLLVKNLCFVGFMTHIV